jgi:hypothetical protein
MPRDARLVKADPINSIRTWLELVPRIKREELPHPATLRRIHAGQATHHIQDSVDCQRSISSRVTTEVAARTVFSGCSKRFAVTTNESALSCAQPENAVTDNAVNSELF